MCAQGGIASVIRLVLIASGHPGVGGVLFFHFAPPQLSETAPTFIARFCLMIINLPLHLRVHNLPLIYFGFFPDAGS